MRLDIDGSLIDLTKAFQLNYSLNQPFLTSFLDQRLEDWTEVRIPDESPAALGAGGFTEDPHWPG